MDSEDQENPGHRKRRGPYKQYLEPGQPLVIPKETKRVWAKKVKLCDENDSNPPDDAPNQGGPCPSTSGGGSPLLSLSNESDDEQEEFQSIYVSPVPSTPVGGDFEEGSNPSDSSDSSSDENDESEDEMPDDMDEDQRTPVFLCHGGCVCGSCTTQEDEPTSAEMMSEKYEMDKRIHPALDCTKFEAFLMVFVLFVRHKLTYASVEDLLKMINTLIGSEVLKTSEYFFRKMFRPNCKVYTHFYCLKCNYYLGEKSAFKGRSKTNCKCGEKCNVKHLKNNFFVTLPVADSIKNYFSGTNVNLVPPTERLDGVYCDVMDGDLYKEKIEPEIKKGRNVLTLTVNTDGARVFKSRGGSMWPIQFIINEINPVDRFKDKNVFLCGLWFGKGSPCMSTFLKPFAEEMEYLGENGVEVKDANGSKTLYHVFAPIASVDSGAKPKILNQKAHNGRFGCSFCTHPNLPVAGYPANQLRYITKLNGETVRCECRCHNTMISDMLAADELDGQGRLGKKNAEGIVIDNVNGLFGLSVMAGIPKFDVVRGFVIDYLHTILLGVVGSLIKFWFDSTEHKTDIHDPASQLKLLDERLKSIKPPQGMTAESKLMSERSEWKGKELRSFGIFYALPCLKDLPKFSSRHFKHVQKLVSAFQMLLGVKITYDQLDLSEKLLDEFVNDFERIYGPIHMTLNIHLLKHVVQVVRSWGPLWCYSNFCFESGNGRLARLVKGTNGVVTQIVEKYLAVRSSSNLMEKFNVSDSVRDFCHEVTNYSYVKNTKQFDDARGLGSQKAFVVTPKDQTALIESGITTTEEGSTLNFYNRMIREGTVYYCRAYEKPQLFDDTCVKLSDNSYAILERFFELPDSRNLHAFVSPIRLSQRSDRLAPLIATGAYDFVGPLKVIEAKHIVAKSVLIQFEEKNFVCDVPNPYERD